MAKIIDHPTSLLLVEGNDDFHVIHALCKQFNVSVRNLENPEGGNFSVVDCKGIDNLNDRIKIIFKTSLSLTMVGVIIDADIDLQIRWNTLKTILTEQGFTFPDVMPENGLILTNEQNRTIGVWIMPNNNLNGMLEDFISFLVPTDDQLLPIVKSTLTDIEEKHLNKYTMNHKSKAEIHTWLAWQEEPGTPMGSSITKRYLTTETETCQALINWLIRLFN